MFHCIGCGVGVSWSGTSCFCYTCSCGATILVDDVTGGLAVPFSVMRSIASRVARPLPHLDDLVGTSDYTSHEKEVLTDGLRVAGFIWMEECTSCRVDGTLERCERREAFSRAVRGVDARLALGELTWEEARTERQAVRKRLERRQ